MMRLDDREAEDSLAGHQSCKLFNAHRLLGVKQVVHSEGIFASRSGVGGWWRGLWLLLRLGRLGLGIVFVVPERCWHPFASTFAVLVQHTNTAVLSDPVAHLQRVNPHGELAGEGGVKEGGGEAAAVASLADDGVHLAVDPDAPVAGALEWLLRKPMVAIPSAQNLNQTFAKFLQLRLAHISFCKPNQMNQEIGC